MGGALALGLKQAADAAIEFESSFAGIRKTVNATEAEFSELAAGMRGMATQIPVDVNELNRIGEAAGQLGIQTDNILGFTRTMADLGVTTNLSSDAAATALARLANIMQTPQSEFDRMGSTIVHLGNNLATTEAELTEFGLRLAGAGKIAGLAESDVLAIGGAMSSVGIEAEAGGTATQKVLLAMTDAANTGGEKLEVFAKTAGMSAKEFAQAWAQDPVMAFTAFVEGLGAAGQKGMGVLRELGLTDQRLIRSFLGLAGAGDVLRNSVELGSAAWQENTALTKEAEQRYGTTASKIQLAKNRINDAAITLGQVMLPAIGAVAGTVGHLAAGISDLPGPLQALAVAGVGAASGLLLLGGGALLLLPRLALAREAMMKIHGTSSLMKGSLMSVGNFLKGPWAGPLAVATVGIYGFAKAKEIATQRVQTFVSALEADSGALGVNTQEAIRNMLAQEGVLDALDAQGTSLPRFTGLINDAAMGSRKAGEEFVGMVKALPAGQRIGAAATLEGLIGGLDQVGLKSKAAGGAQKLFAETVDGTTGAVDELGNELDETATDAEALKAALDDLMGSTIDSERASIAWRESVKSLRETLKDGHQSLEGFSQGAIDNKKAVLDSVDAAMAHGQAVADETGSVAQGARATQDHIRQLIRVATAAGVSKSEIRDYIRQLGLTPDRIETIIRANTGRAQDEVDAFVRNNQGRVIGVRVQATGHLAVGGGRQTHAGGVIGTSGAIRRGHSGLNIRGDEELVIGRRGERMLTERQGGHWDAMRAILRGGAMAPVSTPSPAAGGVVDLAGMEIRGVLDGPFGPQELRGEIVRQIDAREDHKASLKRGVHRKRA